MSLKCNFFFSLCKHISSLFYLPEYSLPELRADGCNRFSISWSLVVRLCVWRNKNNVHTIAATATNSLDLKIVREIKKCGFKIDSKIYKLCAFYAFFFHEQIFEFNFTIHQFFPNIANQFRI